MRTKFKTLIFLVTALMLFAVASTSPAALQAVGPTNAADGFPFWYQAADLSLGQCLEANNGLCILPGAGEEPNFNPALPINFPTNYPSEYFYFIAETFAGPFFYRAALEGAFASADGSPQAGQQMVFARIRIRGDVTVPGTYTVTHPYGVDTFNVPAIIPGPEINFTEDVGIAPGIFTGALAGRIGPFLRNANGTTVTDPATGNIYIANPAVAVAVTGSPNGTNFLRIEGPAGSNLDGLGNNVVQIDQFFVAGKMMGMEVAPASLTFAPQKPNVASAPQTATVKNINTVNAMQIGQITKAANSPNGADFTIPAANDTCSNVVVPPAGTCTFNVVLNSATATNGTRTATVVIPAALATVPPTTLPAGTLPVSGTIDSIAPTIVSTIPDTPGAPANIAVTAVFNENMLASSINSATFFLKTDPGVPVAGVVNYDVPSKTATFTPSALLSVGTNYTATITTGVTDLAGNALAADRLVSFAATPPDTTPPAIASTSPADNSVGALVGGAITATFSEPMRAQTINGTTFTLTKGGAAVTGAVAFNPATNTATFTPSSILTPNTVYVATITAGVLDTTGNALPANVSWTFLTNASPTAPALVFPANGQTGLGATVTLRWNKSQDQEGDPVTYRVQLCRNPSFIGCSPTQVASVELRSVNYADVGVLNPWMLLIGALLAGVSGIGRGRRKLSIFLIVAVVFGALFLVSCGGGGGGGGTPAGGDNPAVQPSNEVSQTMTGLAPNSTYFWKVEASDGKGAAVVSETWTFVTQ